ncbi:MAG: hydrogenase maturation nickel metallochaperone HypA, partial [Campylobacterota bacterium]|nr:hydrogenase maturation nickel metallochaperone HypA [Campylobacterota bacterium]
MHEYSIVQSLIDSCEEHLKENNATKVTKVVVKIGVLSGVEP